MSSWGKANDAMLSVDLSVFDMFGTSNNVDVFSRIWCMFREREREMHWKVVGWTNQPPHYKSTICNILYITIVVYLRAPARIQWSANNRWTIAERHAHPSVAFCTFPKKIIYKQIDSTLHFHVSIINKSNNVNSLRFEGAIRASWFLNIRKP